MPATANKRRKKSTSKRAAEPSERSWWIDLTAAAAAGALLGLSAPGFDQWYLAWFGLVPLLLLIVASSNPGHAFIRGLTFGTAYNLVYLNWYLALYPLNWLGFNDWQGALLAGAAWLIVSLHQGLIVGLFALVCRLLPMAGGFIPRRIEERWHLPTLLVIPLLWVLTENKIGNAHDFLGVPWSMIEYSQYQRQPFIQCASWVGGIGIGFLIVMFNVAAAGLLATVSRKVTWKSLAALTSGSAVRQALTVTLIVTVIYAAGLTSLTGTQNHPSCALSVVQANVNIDMQKTEHRFTLLELLSKQAALLEGSPAGVCVFTESALPTYMRNQPSTIATMAELARHKKSDLVIGAMDRDSSDRPYNSAYGINSAGELLDTVYHKRYLVPFGEYTPYLVQYMPDWLKRLTNTPSGGGFAHGDSPAVLALTAGKIAPLICFETMSPEIVASSVRSGGNLLVNISDLAWFHDSMIGRQMVAFSVMRAVETKRYFVFAANSGPSAIIAPDGKVLSQSQTGKEVLLVGRVGFSSEITPFAIWFR